MDDDEQRCESFEFLPENLRNSLLDFQKDGIKFAIRNHGRCLIGDEMGLGKTLQALSIAYYYKDEWPLLIVVPSSMKYPWIEEIEKWLTDLEPGDINLIRSGTDISNISTAKISILGYGLCGEQKSSKLLVNALKDQAFNVVVLDESHYLKNRIAGRTKFLHPLAKSSKRTILLSGTPSLARPEELYVQLDVVSLGEFGSFSNFATRYCEAHYEFIGKFRKWNTRGACHLDELHKRLNNGIMIRRLKKNVLTQLPPKRRQKITFDLPDSDHKQDLIEAKAEFEQYHQTLRNKQALAQQKTQAMFELNRLSTVLYHYTGLAKAGSIQQYISDLLDGMENKFIVFCRHKQVITAVVQKLAKKNVRYICIDGSVPSSVRGSLVNQFQTNPQVRVAVLAIEAASFGLTLTAADHVVFAELHFTPGVMMQAEDRAHRIGQENAVNVHYLVARGTLDEILWGMLRRKIYVTSSALDGKLADLHAEDGDEETAKQLSICEAWLNEETENNDDATDYLFSQTARKSANKQIEGQQDLRSFLLPPSKAATQDTALDLDEEMLEISASLEKAHSSSSCDIDSPVITVEDSSEDDDCNEDDVATPPDKENEKRNDDCSQNTREQNETNSASSLATSTENQPKITDKHSEKVPEVKHASSQEGSSWSCGACTFINNPQMVECSICFTAKPQHISSVEKQTSGCSSVSKCSSSSTVQPSCSTSQNQSPMSKTSCCKLGTFFSNENAIKDKNSESLEKRAKLWKEIDDSDLDDFEPIGQWSCSACTLLNDAMLIECSMCMTPRRRSQRTASSLWSTKSCEKRRERKKQSGPGKRKRENAVKSCSKTTDVAAALGKQENEDKKVDNVFLTPTLSIEKCTNSRKRLQLEDHDVIPSSESSIKSTTDTTLADSGKELASPTKTETFSTEDKAGTCEHFDNSGDKNEVVKKESQNMFMLELSDSDSTDDEDANLEECGAELSANVQHILDNILSTPTSSSLPSTDIEENDKTDIKEHNIQSVIATDQKHGVEHRGSSTKDTDSDDENETLLELQQAAEHIFGEDSDSDSEIFSLTNNATTSPPLTPSSEASNRSPSLEKSSINVLESSLVSTEESDAGINEGCIKEEPTDLPKPVSLRFALSLYTDRVYLYDKNEDFLKCNFLMSDVRDGSKEDLPYILQLDHNFKQAKTMVQLFSRLGVQQKRVVAKSKLVFKDPRDAYQLCRGMKESSKVRHTTKGRLLKNVKETADKIGGEVRLVTKSPDRKRRKRTGNEESSSPSNPRKPTEGNNSSSADEVSSCLQAFGPDGTPMCLFCKAPVDYGSLGNDWDCRFCSFDCKENYQIRISGTAVRRNLFDSEQGICQLCNYDAHACYNSVKVLQKKDRRAFLEKSIYADLPSRFLNRMILDPKEGMFWEADHIVAVAEGGGECGLENLRTLCVPCHKKETKDLLVRLKTKRQRTDTTGSMSISAFLEAKK